MRKINYRSINPSPSFSIIKNHPIDLGLILRNSRKKNFMTQQEVADEIDISVKVYQKYEYNVSRPPLETVFKLFNLFGISAYEIQHKMKSGSPLASYYAGFDKFSSEEFLQKIEKFPQLLKVQEILLQIECPDCLSMIEKINRGLVTFDKSELKRKLILLKKIIG